MHEQKFKYRKKYLLKTIKELPDELTVEELEEIKSKPRLSKHKKTVYNGIKYHSGWEAKFAAELDKKKNNGLIKDWTRQVKIEFNIINQNGKAILTDTPAYGLKQQNIPFYHICSYYIDFVVVNNDDSLEYIEIKGYETELWRLKFKIFEALFSIIYPDIVIKVIK